MNIDKVLEGYYNTCSIFDLKDNSGTYVGNPAKFI